jgi:hypothetical protein
MKTDAYNTDAIAMSAGCSRRIVAFPFPVEAPPVIVRVR